MGKLHAQTKLVLVSFQLHPIEASYFFFDLPSIKKNPTFFFILLQKGYRFENSTAEKKVAYFQKIAS